MRFRDRDEARLANAFYRAKAREYRATLLALSRRYGHPRKAVVLSEEIRVELRREARDHARKVCRSTNRAMGAEARQRKDLTPAQLVRHLRSFGRERAARRSDLIAQQEIATARLDAEVSFYRENGLEPLFDFKGRKAVCRLCERLKAKGPWPIDVVIQIGQPHIGCRHRWRSRTRALVTLTAGGLRPGQISAGRGTIAGIVGSDPLVNAHGSIDDALAFLDTIEIPADA